MKTAEFVNRLRDRLPSGLHRRRVEAFDAGSRLFVRLGNGTAGWCLCTHHYGIAASEIVMVDVNRHIAFLRQRYVVQS